MADVFDYIDWRGDIPFSVIPLNEVDALILARFAYIRFEHYIPGTLAVQTTVEQLSERFDWEKETFLLPGDKPLFEKMAASIRFKDIRISGFINKIHEGIEEQFCAVCFEDPTFTYVAFRGTDNTLIGWKEDFNLSFMPKIPSQVDALNYVNEIAKYKKNIILGGHSKGGNIAIYSGVFSDAYIKDIYNFDGPGFVSSIVESKDYQSCLNRIHTYIPQSSIIGVILNHGEKCHIVKSTSNGPNSHDMYTWNIMGPKIVRAQKLSENSRFFVKTMEKWMKEISPEERHNLVDTVFDMLVDEPNQTVVQWKSKWYSTLKNTISSYKQLDSESKDQITDSAFQLLNSVRSTFFDMTKKGEDR